MFECSGARVTGTHEHPNPYTVQQMNKLLLTYISLANAVLFLLPGAVMACEKCYGSAAANSPTVRGIGLAMLALIIITGIVLGGIVMFFIYMRKRAKMLESGQYIVNEQGVLLSLPAKLLKDSQKF